MLSQHYFQGNYFIYLLLWNKLSQNLVVRKKRRQYWFFWMCSWAGPRLVSDPPSLSWGAPKAGAGGIWGQLPSRIWGETALCWDLTGAVSLNTFTWPLHAAWSSPQHSGWVPRVSTCMERESWVGAVQPLTAWLGKSPSITSACPTHCRCTARPAGIQRLAGFSKNMWACLKTTTATHCRLGQIKMTGLFCRASVTGPNNF